jgi:hypothetical protein
MQRFNVLYQSLNEFRHFFALYLQTFVILKLRDVGSTQKVVEQLEIGEIYCK